MPADSRVQQAVLSHAAAREQLARAAAASAQQQVRHFTDWYSTAAITALTLRIALLVEAAQRQTAAVTDSYLARVLTLLLGRPVQPAGPVDVTGLRQGITHPGVYGRLADQYRFEISQGQTPETVLEHVTNRAATMARTDIDLAFRAQTHDVLIREPSITGYRRVIHPELSRGGSCGLCVAASDRIYFKDELLPMHDNCHCTVLPILGGQDPGSRLNAADLKAIYAAAGATAAAALKRTRYVVQDHGELGPVLRPVEDAFRDAADVAAASTH